VNDETLEYLASPVEFFERRRPLSSVMPAVFFGAPCFLLIGPAAHELVHASHRHLFSHAVGYHRVNAIFGGPHLAEQRVMLGLDGPPWQAQHDLVLPFFSPASLRRVLGAKRELYERGLEEWAVRGEVDLSEALHLLTLRSALRGIYGLDIDDCAEAVAGLITEIMVVSLVTFADPSTHERAAIAHRELTRLLSPQIDAKRAEPKDDLVSAYVTDRSIAGRALDDDEVMSCLVGQFFAAHGTTRSLMTTVLGLLLRYPAYAARVIEEIESAVGGRSPEYTHLANSKQMPALENLVKEAERLYPPLHVYSRGVLEDVSLDGFTIPKGALVHVMPVATHYDPAIFENPRRFDPDRFAAPRLEDRRHAYCLNAFGGGERICVGRQLSRLDVKMMTILCLQRFRMERLEPGELEIVWSPEPLPKGGLRVALTRRERSAA
jgi:retinoid hydroxylase